ncbi:Flp family type IVb pilin [Lutimaribacter sp. EGI FJ00015]|uniref:Flp family type IVb pilin n=1 Tax=Lutimaribacter degradans TaxID=2945989 RepID=A0ACC5ZZW1_9RHOB|nr:Flp family type IVb pilin [Lutimaribacter sp. EGI FJ00013]MCM2563360.1 Flp family type IVb pilin [Lutimaribacter sp. EGI FJ00013]MCO0614562.1 Flp family type IVb pilin [Lutimaribacter sp. EGI FJ00015]MCO0637234.1 Flp family type IVb pilin [Lutimaribacter sp. EGI FJ00014]
MLKILKTQFDKFIRDTSGATAIEYGLIAALVAVAIIAALTALGTDLTELFGGISTELESATPE